MRFELVPVSFRNGIVPTRYQSQHLNSLSDSGSDPEGKFFDVLGSKGKIKSAEEAGDDSEFEKESKVQVKLYR